MIVNVIYIERREKIGTSDECRIRDFHSVMDFISWFQTSENGDCVGDIRLVN